MVHFRMDKGWAYIPIDETISDPYTNAQHTAAGEQKLRILSEELKPEPKPGDKPAGTPPSDAKSPDPQ